MIRGGRSDRWPFWNFFPLDPSRYTLVILVCDVDLQPVWWVLQIGERLGDQIEPVIRLFNCRMLREHNDLAGLIDTEGLHDVVHSAPLVLG